MGHHLNLIYVLVCLSHPKFGANSLKVLNWLFSLSNVFYSIENWTHDWGCFVSCLNLFIFHNPTKVWQKQIKEHLCHISNVILNCNMHAQFEINVNLSSHQYGFIFIVLIWKEDILWLIILLEWTFSGGQTL